MSIRIDKNMVITEAVIAAINYIIELMKETPARKRIVEKYGEVWNSKEFNRDFDVIKFADPFVYVRRKKDNMTGTMIFQPCPRYYYRFQEI